MSDFRVKFTTALTFGQMATAAEARGYIRAEDGEDKKPGLYGRGFVGECLIILNDNDDGAWFDKLVEERRDPGEVWVESMNKRFADRGAREGGCHDCRTLRLSGSLGWCGVHADRRPA